MLHYWLLTSLSLISTLWIGPFPPVPGSETVAQAPFSNLNQVEQLNNPDWQIVPGAAVGRHPEETLMDINGIVRDGDAVTFDVMGHRGVYYRMIGDCETSQVILTRRGLSQGFDDFLYEPVEPGEAETSDWNRRLLAFACQSSNKSKSDGRSTLQVKQNSISRNSEYILNISGTLSTSDSVFPDGSFYRIHTFVGRANQEISISLESSEFNTFLGLVSPGEEILGQDFDLSGRNFNSTVAVTLPSNGTYLVVVKGLDRSSRGRYTLRVQENSSTPTLASSPNSTPNPDRPSGSLQAETRPGFQLYRYRNNYSIEYPENWVIDSASSTNRLTIWSQRPSRQSGGGFFGDMVKTEVFIDSRPFNANRIVGEIGRRPDAQITRRGDITIGGQRALRIWSEDQHARTISSYIEYSSNQTVEIHSFYAYGNDSWIETIQDIHWSFRKMN
jgi:hypothetical protein